MGEQQHQDLAYSHNLPLKICAGLLDMIFAFILTHADAPQKTAAAQSNGVTYSEGGPLLPDWIKAACLQKHLVRERHAPDQIGQKPHFLSALRFEK